MAITSILQFHVAVDRIDDARAVITETLVATRSFDGCLGVDVMLDADDPTYFVIVERWASLEADDAYRAWRASNPASLREIVEGAPQLNRLETLPGV